MNTSWSRHYVVIVVFGVLNASAVPAHVGATKTGWNDLAPEVRADLRIGTHNSKPAVIFEAANVLVWDGTGSTSGTPTGLGNLIVGYDELSPDPWADDKTGSHNLMVGPQHTYSKYGGLVAGYNSSVTGAYASVSGGANNTASSVSSSVSGGYINTASGAYSSVSGGKDREASGGYDWAAGSLSEDN